MDNSIATKGLTNRELNFIFCDYYRLSSLSEKTISFIKKDTEEKLRIIGFALNFYNFETPSLLQFNGDEFHLSEEKPKIRMSRFGEVSPSIFSKKDFPKLLPLNEIEWINNLPLGHLAYLILAIQKDLPTPTDQDHNPNEINILQLETDKKVLVDLITLEIDLTFKYQASVKAINLAKKCQSQAGAIKPVLRLIERNKGIKEWLFQYQINYNPSLDLANTPFNQNFNIEIHEKILFNSLVLGESTAELELFHKKASSAWSQKKFRDNNSHKKIQNYNIDKNSIKQLDKLCRHRGVKKNDMIEKLIRDAYAAENFHKKTE